MTEKNSAQKAKSIIIVAGMHRSGTSAITRCLNLYGATLPEDLLKPVKNDNDMGFWESQVLMELHDEILASLGGSWSSLTPVPEQWFVSPEAELYKNRLIKLINEQYQEIDLAIVKDPRICKLIPLWESALAEMGVNPYYIISLRNPMEIAQSLARRNNFELKYALSLWFVHLRILELNTRAANRVFIRYDDLLNNHSKFVSRLCEHLPLPLNWQSVSAKESVDNFLDGSMRHHEVQLGELIAKRNVPKVVKYFYTWLDGQANIEGNGASKDIGLDIESALKENAHTEFVMYLRNIEMDEQQLNNSYRRLNQQTEKIGRHMERNDLAQENILRLNQKIHSIKSELTAKEAELTAKEAQLTAKEAQLTAKETELDKYVRTRDQYVRGKLLEAKRQAVIASDTLEQAVKEKEGKRFAFDKLQRMNSNQEVQISTLSKEKSQLRQSRHDAEFALQGVTSSSAWKLGTLLYSSIRRVRLSIFGKSLLFVKALVTLNLRNYLNLRRRLLIVNESGLFDAAHYLQLYPLIRYSIRSPLEHYVGHGEREGRLPNAGFNPFYYAQQLTPGENKWHSLLVHYIKQGAKENYDPNPEFSTRLYRKKHKLDSDKNPLAHYLNRAKEGTSENQSDLASIEPSQNNRFSYTPLMSEIEEIIADVSSQSLEDKLASLNFEKNSVSGTTPKVSIIIPFYNKFEYTVNCLFALQLQSFTDYEIILVDDASDNSECRKLASIKGVTLIRNRKNAGYLASCNKAANKSQAEYILQLNNDTLPLQGWLENLVKTFEYYPDTGVAGSLMLGEDGLIQEAGGIIFNDASGYNYGRGKHHSESRFNYCREVNFCSGASILIKRSVWKKLGGYDDRYTPAYYEDADIAMAAHESGYKVIYNPFSRLVHYEGVSSGTNVTQGVKRYQEINKDKFYRKWKTQLDARPPVPPANHIDQYVRGQVKRGWILWIDSNTPTPDKDAGSIETVHFFERALEDGWGVSFIPWDAFRHEGRYTTDLQYMGIECLYDGAAPAQSPADCLEQLDDVYDVVVLSRATVAKYTYPLIKSRFPNAKIIFNTVDLHFLRYERELELLKKHPKYKMPARSQKVSKQDELFLVKACDATIVVSEVEAQIICQSITSANIAVIPLFGDVIERVNSYEKRLNVGFIGGYQHPPNVDAVKYFVADIWPLVRLRIKDCKFIIAGSHVSDEVSGLASKSVEVRGFVPTVGEFLEGVRIMVAPLRYGAGIKGKIVSGLCHGVPQVVSHEASEGMGLEHDNDVMIAQSPEQFADLIIKLYNDQGLWEKMADNATKAAERLYSKEVLSVKISDLLDEMKPYGDSK
jgi:GT2 family glycosyltransferase